MEKTHDFCRPFTLEDDSGLLGIVQALAGSTEIDEILFNAHMRQAAPASSLPAVPAITIPTSPFRAVAPHNLVLPELEVMRMLWSVEDSLANEVKRKTRRIHLSSDQMQIIRENALFAAQLAFEPVPHKRHKH